MALRLKLVTALFCMALLVAFGACTDTPTAGHNAGEQNEVECPEGQHFDAESEECVANQTLNQNQNTGQNQSPGNQVNGAEDLDPYDDESRDGVPNKYDNCPFHNNPDQTDTAGDGVGDACDNCPHVANPDQEYSEDNPVDERGIIMGDACVPGETYVDTETDDSGDGVPTVMDNCPEHYNPPLEVGCSCSDGSVDCAECVCSCEDGIYPCDGCEQPDTSGDGVGDVCDNCPDHYNPNQTQSPGNPTYPNRYDGDGNPMAMGDACAPEPNNIPICDTMDTEFQQIMPNVYIAFDLSGSMGWEAPSGRDRIDEALDGLDLIAEELHDEIRFGLGTFPDDHQAGCSISHELDVGNHSESALKNLWGSFDASGATPMHAIMQDIHQNHRVTDPGDQFDDQRVKAVLLVTDGVANCSSGNSQQNVVNAITNLYNDGILTFVVGFDLQDSSLESYAEAGGTGTNTPYGGHFLADEANELAQAMRDVADLLVSCTYTLEPAPEDANKIWIDVDGQYYLDQDQYEYNPSDNTLTLDDDACEDVRALEEEELRIEIQMGCASQCEPEEPRGMCDLWYESCGEEICEPCEPEICDGQDNNCSGVVDDNCPDCGIYMAECETTDDCCEPFICNEEGYCDRDCYPTGAPCVEDDDCCQLCAIESGNDVGTCISN